MRLQRGGNILYAEHKLVINGLLPNLNDYIKQLNISKFRGAELKRDTELNIGLHIKQQLKSLHINESVFVIFNWYEENKKRDKDNVASAKKFIFDALVASSVLKNDGWANVNGFSDNFFIDKNNPRVEVIIQVSPCWNGEAL